MSALTQCPEELPPDLSSLVESFGRAWAESPARPRPSPSVIKHWSELLAGWAGAIDLPLFVRKHANNRGSTVIHDSGRVLVPTDNSPAHWAYILASRGECPSLDDIRTMLAKDIIPVVMIQKAVEKPWAKYHCSLGKQFNVNEFGWKLAHIEKVGLHSRTALDIVSLDRLIIQFLRLMTPANMFVVPLAWAGIAEIDSVMQAIASSNQKTFR